MKKRPASAATPAPSRWIMTASRSGGYRLHRLQPPNYPNLTGLFAHLGVPSHASDMTFAASIRNGWLEWGA